MSAKSATASLYLVNPEDPSLSKIIFEYDLELGQIISQRGTSQFTSHSFLWSTGVKAITCLFITAALYKENSNSLQELPTLSGDANSLASTLDYALSKNPTWLADMFGTSRDGSAYARQLLLRTNSERKRPGPVLIQLNPQIISCKNIQIFLDSEEITDREHLQDLYQKIEDKSFIRRKSPSIIERIVIENFKKPRAEKSEYDENYCNSLTQRKNIKSGALEHLITTIELENDYIFSIRKREIERKFGFIGEKGARTWEKLCKSSNYIAYNNSLKLLELWKDEFCSVIKRPVNFILIWPGNCEKESRIVSALANHHKVTIHIVDTSQEIIHIALSKTENICCEQYGYVADFNRKGTLSFISNRARSHQCESNLILMYGGTVGIENTAQTLKTIYDGLGPKDYVLIEIFTHPEITEKNRGDALDELVSQYAVPEYLEHILSSLSHINITTKQGVVEVEGRFSKIYPKVFMVEAFFRFTENVKRNFAGENFNFSEGDRILLDYRYLYTSSQFQELLKNNGFKIVLDKSISDHSHQLLCVRDFR